MSIQSSRAGGALPRRLEFVLLLIIMALSLFLRLSALDVFLTTDEDHWYDRSRDFNNALRSGNLKATYLSPHPGVVSMWIGTLAIRLSGVEDPGLYEDFINERTAEAALAPEDSTTLYVGLPPLMVHARMILAVVTWLALWGMYALARKLFGPLTALISIALLALDPFYLAHSRLHHLDAILASFMALSALSLVVYRNAGGRRRYLILSAITGGLAMANKSPGLFLLPWTGLALVLPVLYCAPAERLRTFKRAIIETLIWCLVAGLTVFAIWPALWVNPIETLRNVMNTAVAYAENPHENSNFFWFAIRPDPGPAFYVVSWIFRTTPIVILGLLALGIWGRRRFFGEIDLRARVLPLLLVALGFATFMTLGEKKFDRYGLPFYLPLDILAALGWAALLNRLALNPPRRFLAPGRILGRAIELLRSWGGLALVGLLALGQFALLWPTRPYYLSYYNPVVGGGPAASQILLVGWGEGLDRAADYLNAKPDAAQLRIATWQLGRMKTFFAGQTYNIENVPLAKPDYFVHYSNSVQRRIGEQSLEVTIGQEEPEYVVTINGIDYVWIYANRSYEQEIDQALAYIADHGDPASDIILLDIDAAFARRYDGPFTIEVLEGPPREDFVLTGLQRLTAGAQRVWFLTFPDSRADTRGLIRDTLSSQGETVYSERFGELKLQCLTLDPDKDFATAPTQTLGVRLGQDIDLLGYELSPETPIAGQSLRVRLFWRVEQTPAVGYNIFVHLLGPDGQILTQGDSTPQDGLWPTFMWMPGQTVLTDVTLDLPVDLPSGCSLAVGLYDLETMQRLPVYAADGTALPDDRVLIPNITAP